MSELSELLELRDLVIETTRRCNMKCQHCLRGDAANLDMEKEYIDSLLNQISSILSVTFSGGEPSLNVNIINYFLEQCKKKDIYLGSFYIATNGLNISEDFVLTCLKLYSYCDEKEICIVEVSNDVYHAMENNYNTELLDGLTFFKRKFQKESYDYENNKYLIGEGRAFNLSYRELSLEPIKDMFDFEETTLYLNCKGNIINGCDWSYESQDRDDVILCSVNNLTKFYNQLEIKSK